MMKIVQSLNASAFFRVLCFLAVLLGQPGFGSEVRQTMAEMFHRNWTTRDGAPTGINAMTQGTDGFLWFGTDDGLYRFDGVSFEQYLPLSGDPLLSATIAYIVAAPDGGLWIGYPSGGVSRLKNGHNRNYGPKDGLPSGYFVGFAQDRAGAVWATNLTDLFRLNGDRWQKIGEEWSYHAKLLARVFVDSRGTLWVGTETQLLSLPEGERRFHVSATVKGGVSDIAEAPDGTIWIGLWNTSQVQPAVLSDGQPVQNPTVIHLRTAAMTFAADKSLWIPTSQNGLFRIRSPLTKGETYKSTSVGVEHFSAKDGLSSDLSVASLQDREGDIWIFTGGGVDQFRHAAFTAVKVPADFNRIGLLADGSNSVLAGSTTVLKISNGRPEAFNRMLQGVTCLYRDPHGTIWLGADDGLQRSTQNNRFLKLGLPDELDPRVHPIQSLTLDHEGALWVSIIRAGIYRFFRGVWTRADYLAVGPHLSAVVETTDSHGRVWFGLRENRILLLDHGKVTSFGPHSGLLVGTVTAICEYAGRLWVGGDSGLQFYSQEKFLPVRLAGDAFLRRVTGIIQTSNGDLWINQASGVIRIDAIEIAQIVAARAHYAHSTLYNYLDGFVGTALQQRPLPTAAAAGDGKIYFVTRTGVFWVDPRDIPVDRQLPRVALLRVRADGMLLREPTTISLPAKTGNLQIDYSAPSLSIPQRVWFRYRLEGYDLAWQDAGTRRQAFYSRVPPGHYTFHVIASNGDGLWNDSGTSLALTFTPSFTQTAFFRILCLSLALFGLWLLYHLRLRRAAAQIKARLYERLAERERIARDLHDTFFQAIQGLLLRFNTGTKQLPADEPARCILEEALKQSDEVMLEGRELLLDLRTGGSEEHSMASAFAASGKQLQDIYSAGFQVIVNGEPRSLHPIVYDEITALGKEALYNAFRHANARNIEAEVSFETGHFRVRIRDDGDGIDPRILNDGHREGHWGLPGMRERAKKLGAQFEIWSRMRTGTEIEVRVAAAVAYKTKIRRFPHRWRPRIFRKPEEVL